MTIEKINLIRLLAYGIVILMEILFASGEIGILLLSISILFLILPFLFRKFEVHFLCDTLCLLFLVIMTGSISSTFLLILPVVIFSYAFIVPKLKKVLNFLYVITLGLSLPTSSYYGKNLGFKLVEFEAEPKFVDFIFYPSAFVLLLYFGAILGSRFRKIQADLVNVAEKTGEFFNQLPFPIIVYKNGLEIFRNYNSEHLNVSLGDLNSGSIIETEGKIYSVLKSKIKGDQDELEIIYFKDISEFYPFSEKNQAQHTVDLGSEDFIATSPVMKKVANLISRIAPTDASVLITGDSGTGKTLIAEMIHKHSPRKNGPFLVVNCGSIPAELLESELFGCAKGAFTGAVERKGLFLEASGGTLLLDEIGELSLNLQVKLLRAIQERRIKPLGKNEEIEVDVRLIFATNVNLEEAVKNGSFREDLFYRINVVRILVPPLKDRKEDIPQLIHSFLERKGYSGYKFHPSAMEFLINYEYPGNVRELENMLERAVILSESKVIRREHFEIEQNNTPTLRIIESDYELPVDLDTLLAQIECSLLKKALASVKDKNDAAKLLNISTRSLRYRLQKHGISF